MFAISFVVNAILFGVGLAMDAFSVSLVNGLNEPDMKKKRMFVISGAFAFFQTIMPLLGWFFVHSIASLFTMIQRYIPWIAFALLLYIGGNMVYTGVCEKRNEGDIKRKQENKENAVSAGSLLLQGIATSIDALSVGFTISSYGFAPAFLESFIIGAVTFVISFGGIVIGKKFGAKFSGGSSILGGIILIGIGIRIACIGV